MSTTLWAQWLFAVLSWMFLLGTGILVGRDLERARRARQDAVDAEKMRTAIRNAATVGYEPPLRPDSVATRRACANGPEHCLCESCAPTEHRKNIA